MAASKYDFNLEQGSSFRMSLVYKDSDGNVIDLTNWCARLIWKTNLNNTQTFSTDNVDYSVYKFTIEPELGKLTLLIPAATTNSFVFNTAKYDLELQSDDDLYSGGGKSIIRLLYGTMTVAKRFSQTSDLLECSV
jgi:DNA polymerase III sliding clamp (beta) subunit (PCNA family)